MVGTASAGTTPGRTSSRRQRRHEATAEEIRQVARELMARDGTSSLNLRAVAREMGMTPSALYRYYASRDAILTALIIEAYDQVGETVEQAIAAAPLDASSTRILAGVHAFRRWAVEHPHEFGLIYGTPVPGYEAPRTESLSAAMRTGAAMFGELVRAVDSGLLVPPDDDTVPAELHPSLRELLLDPRAELPISAVALAVQFWMVLLGALSSEVFGHKPEPLAGGETGRLFFDYTIRQTLIAMGMARNAVEAGVSPPA
ncbi:MAG: TetR/AcrR family transcriptional regulator [Kineosporiaceae bacterium]|nr:TetR/AcrR family transcriptional regulator [Kineosporiaceae bacterium]